MSTQKPAPVVKWPGSKWRIAEWIIGHMPSHHCYIEPFFGSGAVFFNKTPSNCEIINDQDGMVVNLFRLIRENPDALADAIALTPWSREEYETCRADVAVGDDVEKARRFLVGMWQGIGVRRYSLNSERATGSNGWRSRSRFDQSPTATWSRLPGRIQVAAKRLLEAQIEQRPAADVISRNADSEVLLYVDPPYLPSSRSWEARRLYAHELTDAQHLELLQLLEAHPGPVLLSGYDSDLYNEQLAHWRRLEIDVRAQNNAERTEILWLNPVCVSRLNRTQLLLEVQ